MLLNLKWRQLKQDNKLSQVNWSYIRRRWIFFLQNTFIRIISFWNQEHWNSIWHHDKVLIQGIKLQRIVTLANPLLNMSKTLHQPFNRLEYRKNSVLTVPPRTIINISQTLLCIYSPWKSNKSWENKAAWPVNSWINEHQAAIYKSTYFAPGDWRIRTAE